MMVESGLLVGMGEGEGRNYTTYLFSSLCYFRKCWIDLSLIYRSQRRRRFYKRWEWGWERGEERARIGHAWDMAGWVLFFILFYYQFFFL